MIVSINKEANNAASVVPTPTPTPVSTNLKAATELTLIYTTLGSFSWDQDTDKVKAEKELQHNKSQTLASKLSDIKYIDQRCLKLEQRVASQQFIISSIKSQLDHLETVYTDQIQQFRSVMSDDHLFLSCYMMLMLRMIWFQIRVLKSKVENLEELDKEKDKYYALKTRDIDEFRVKAEIFSTECERRVEELRCCVNELNSSFIQLQHSTGYTEDSDLAAAEMRKSELLAMKENLDRKLASNYETKAQLQKQLKNEAYH
ncbi:hypothetical protein E3N88_36769 [Mikania micrantha]|uniref:Uncharacterized protein n=1 Tax=Mikania micrantha TaxID=192012 RepID=A0A5N6M4P3_9ASTR|nr:hypothetical protein E3N88_36769 [Mikania micrantha]